MGIEAAIAATAVSAISGANSARAIGKSQQVANEYNAAVSERNAKVNEQDAVQLKIQSELEIAQFQKEFRNLQDATSQAFRFNGFVAESGTPLKVALASAKEADNEIAIRRYNADLGEQRLKESALQNKMQADLSRLYGRQARAAGNIRAGQSLLAGFTSVANLNASSSLSRQNILGNINRQKQIINSRYG